MGPELLLVRIRLMEVESRLVELLDSTDIDPEVRVAVALALGYVERADEALKAPRKD